MLRYRAPLWPSSVVFTLGVLGSSPAVSQDRALQLHPKGLNSVVAGAALEAHRRLGGPGSQVVHFCGDRFTHALETRGPGFLAAVVIHEELHSVGLGENPPTSGEITRRIEERCGP